MKFTFKTEKAKGPYSSFFPDNHLIKFNKKEVGYISDGEGFKIHLQAIKKDINEDKNPNCPWKWVIIKQTFNTLQESKNWLNEHIEDILATIALWQEN